MEEGAEEEFQRPGVVEVLLLQGGVEAQEVPQEQAVQLVKAGLVELVAPAEQEMLQEEGAEEGESSYLHLFDEKTF